MKPSLTYADAGVDIEKANAFVKTVKTMARQTHRPDRRHRLLPDAKPLSPPLAPRRGPADQYVNAARL